MQDKQLKTYSILTGCRTIHIITVTMHNITQRHNNIIILPIRMLIVIDTMVQSEVEVLLVPSRFCKLLMVALFALEIIAGVISV